MSENRNIGIIVPFNEKLFCVRKNKTKQTNNAYICITVNNVVNNEALTMPLRWRSQNRNEHDMN